MESTQPLEAKADMVAHSVLLLTREMLSGFEKDSEEVQQAGDKIKESFKLLLIYTNLFNAEKYFSEQLDSDTYRVFTQRLESHFNVEGEAPKLFLNHIRKLDNWLPYFGSEAVKIIRGKSNDDAVLAMDLAIIYSSFANGFFEGLKRAWKLVSDYPNI